MIRMKPSPPLGAYPQFRLCGQDGSAPSTIRTSIISRIEPNDIIFPFKFTADTGSEPSLSDVPFGSVSSVVEQR